MAHLYRNMTGNTARDLRVSPSPNVEYTDIRLCNVHSSNAVIVDLYVYKKRYTDSRVSGSDSLRKKYNKENPTPHRGVFGDLTYEEDIYYILKNVTIPKGVTLILNKNDFTFDNRSYKLYIKLNASDSAVDVQLSTSQKIKDTFNQNGEPKEDKYSLAFIDYNTDSRT